MRAVYMGDEAIVDCQTFTLAGGDDTTEHLKATGQYGLGLNFAVMRSVVAGERAGDSPTLRAAYCTSPAS